MTDDIDLFRQQVIEAHRPAFELHSKIAATFEAAIGNSRRHPQLVDLVLDMLMLQAHKSYGAVALLGQHGLLEDTATISRRMMELGVQAVYIGAQSDRQLGERRAGMYLAFMWRNIAPRHRDRLPLGIRNQWADIAKQYGEFVSENARAWGPNWRDMFTAIGAEDLYLEDYSLLSGFAHGSPEHQIFAFSEPTIRLHRHDFVSILIAYSSRYYLMVAEPWNARFNLAAPARINELRSAVLAFRSRAESDPEA